MWSAQTVDAYLGGQPRAKREVVGKPSRAQNVVEVIGLVDQGARRVRASDLFDEGGRVGYIIF